jgi:hypothetical protein
VRFLLLAILLSGCTGLEPPDGVSDDAVDGATARSDGGVVPGPGADLAPPSGSPDLAMPPSGALTPATGASSGGTGGAATSGVATRTTASGVAYRLIVPSTYTAGHPTPLLVVYSGTEGGATMAANLVGVEQVAPGLSGMIRAVLDGVQYNGNGAAGADVLDEVRAQYDVDNDRTYLLGESAGTTAAFALGFHLRQSYFAAYWANDVSAASADGPALTAAQLGFTPSGQVGPGGASALAAAIAGKLVAAGYHTDPTTPYAGSGSGTHGAPDQFIAAVSWFSGKTR